MCKKQMQNSLKLPGKRGGQARDGRVGGSSQSLSSAVHPLRHPPGFQEQVNAHDYVHDPAQTQWVSKLTRSY